MPSARTPVAIKKVPAKKAVPSGRPEGAGRTRDAIYGDGNEMTQVNFRLPRELKDRLALHHALSRIPQSALVVQGVMDFQKHRPWMHGFPIEQAKAIPTTQNGGRGDASWQLMGAYITVPQKKDLQGLCEVLSKAQGHVVSMATLLYNVVRWYMDYRDLKLRAAAGVPWPPPVTPLLSVGQLPLELVLSSASNASKQAVAPNPKTRKKK